MNTNATLHTLSNGLTVLFEENHNAPVISLNALVKVGSAMETPREAGIAHFIEHMMFKGTPTRPAGRIAYDVEAAGGEINAYTSFDQTVYYINMTQRQADEGIAILGDALSNPLFEPEEITREAEVICEEIRRSDDHPGHRLSDLLFGTCLHDHPYGKPILGSYKTVNSFRRQDLQSFWKRWYTADNMVFIVVGDFDTKKMLPKIERAFGGIRKKRARAPQDITAMAKTSRCRAFHERMAVQHSHFALGFPIPHILHDDIPLLDLAAHVLSGGDSARLDQVVREQKELVHSIYSYAYSARGSGILVLGGSSDTAKVRKAIPAIWDEVRRAQRDGISSEELERAKLSMHSSQLYEKETVGGIGGKYAYYLATAGDYQYEQWYYEHIQRASASDVQSALQRYVTPERCTLSWLAPEGDVLPSKAQTVALCKTPAKSKSRNKASTTSDGLTSFRIPGGPKVVVQRNTRLPLVSCYLTGFGGVRYETTRNNGINTLLASTLTKGTSRRSAEQIATAIDNMAGTISASSGRNSFGVRADFLSSKMSEGFALLGEILQDPSFAPDEVAKEQRLQLAGIQSQQDNLATVAVQQFSKALFGKHPYALPTLGSASSVSKLTPRALRSYYENIVRPSELVISFAGDITPDHARTIVEEHLSWEHTAAAKSPKIAAAPDVRARTIRQERPGKQQSHIFYGVRGTTAKHKDRFALAVLNQILSGQGGRLFLSLRDQQSLAYSVTSMLQLGVEPGYFAVYIGTDPSKVDTAIDGFQQHLAAMRDHEVSNDELDRAIQHIVGTYDLDLQRNASIASMHALNVLYGLGLRELSDYPERILQVTARDVRRVAKKYLREDAAICSIVGP